jgi:hypothetical protein
MPRWFDRSHEERPPEEHRPDHSAEAPANPYRVSGAHRRDRRNSRWRRSDRPTSAAEWEVAEFYDSFENPRP